MASAYFTLPSFARAKKNQEELERSNPQNPVLKDEDEKFLERQISQDQAGKDAEHEEVTAVTDEGEVRPASNEEQKAAQGDAIVPETQPKSPEPQPDVSKKQKQKDIDLPSQEEAEKVTRSWNDTVKLDDGGQSAEKRTWASYIPTKLRPTSSKEGSSASGEQKEPESPTNQRTWAEYASNLALSRESLPSVSWPQSWTWSKDKDAKAEPVYNEDGTINEEKTKEKQEKEVSVLLDNLNMSTYNQRVFALSEETRKIYDRFAQVLKDTMNGAPTAYDDMEKLMKEAGPQLEKSFKSMPPFVQTLVKSLPAKLSTTLAPEIMAAASEKPGADAKKMEEASKASGSGANTSKGGKSKEKKKIPGMKKLMSSQGVVATMLRNTVNFIQTRFPFLASTTNVVMSLAVFILMFVFWYCHKRGREVRLAAAAEAENAEASSTAATDGTTDEKKEDEDENGDIEVSASDDDGDDATAEALERTLNQPDPAEVPLPRTESELKEA